MYKNKMKTLMGTCNLTNRKVRNMMLAGLVVVTSAALMPDADASEYFGENVIRRVGALSSLSSRNMARSCMRMPVRTLHSSVPLRSYNGSVLKRFAYVTLASISAAVGIDYYFSCEIPKNRFLRETNRTFINQWHQWDTGRFWLVSGIASMKDEPLPGNPNFRPFAVDTLGGFFGSYHALQSIIVIGRLKEDAINEVEIWFKVDPTILIDLYIDELNSQYVKADEKDRAVIECFSGGKDAIYYKGLHSTTPHGADALTTIEKMGLISRYARYKLEAQIKSEVERAKKQRVASLNPF